MTLRDTVTRWHVAMCLLDENRLDEAAHKLLEIQKPSAKIFYNLGLVCMLQRRYRDAIQYLNTSIDQDKYMAIALYQRGLCYYEIQRFDTAKSDFLSARSMIRNDGIDYKQLGAEVLLSPQLLDHCIAITEECLSKKQTDGRLQALPVRDCVLRPQKALVDNLVKQSFLGNAKVISSAKGEDIATALEMRKAQDLGVKTWTSASVPSSPASGRHALSTSNANKMFIPPPPKRPPPRLPGGATDSQRQRLKSRSLEDMTVNHVIHHSSIVEDKSKMGHIMISPKPKPAVSTSSLVAETPLSSEHTDASAHPHSETAGRVLTHILGSGVVRNHVTDILPGQLHLPDKQAPSLLVVNHASDSALTHQNEGKNQSLGHVSGGHAAQMKLLFERKGKQEEKLTQEGIQSNTQKCKLDSELRETIMHTQKKRLDIQQSKSGNYQQNRTNIQQGLSSGNSQQNRTNIQGLSSSSSSTAPSSSIQKSVKPVRPPPPKFSK